MCTEHLSAESCSQLCPRLVMHPYIPVMVDQSQERGFYIHCVVLNMRQSTAQWVILAVSRHPHAW